MGTVAEIVVVEPRNEFDFVWDHIPQGVDRTSIVVQARMSFLVPLLFIRQLSKTLILACPPTRTGYKRLALFTGEISDPAERQQILDAWAKGDTNLVVATSAFGMGVDKADVQSHCPCVPSRERRPFLSGDWARRP